MMAEAAYPSPSPWHVKLRRNLAQSLVRQGRAGETVVTLQPALPAARAFALQHPEMLPSVLNSLTVAFLT